MKPDISVVMSVYNGEKTITHSVESVLNQTFQNIELVIVDDGSYDETQNVLSSFHDERIIVVKNKHDYIDSLNIGLEIARGKYIAKMDADDYMHPERLQFQWMFMERHTEIDICSTWMQSFGMSQVIISNYSDRLDDTNYILLKGNPISHPTVMMRNDVLREKKLQYMEYTMAEDYKLWFEASKKGLSFYVIPLILHYYRHSKDQQTSKHRIQQIQTTHRIKEEILEYIVQEHSPLFIRKYLREILTLYRKNYMSLEQACNMFLFAKENILIKHFDGFSN